MKDAEIVRLYWRREESAIEETALQYTGYCYSIAYGILASEEDSEECVSDTWLRAWNAIPPAKPNRLSLFLGKITRNLALDCCKKTRAKKREAGSTHLILDELQECIASSETVEQAAAGRELEEQVNRFLHNLPRRECNIFLMRYWYNQSLFEIAEKLSVKESNVKASLFRSRKKLRKHLEKEGVL